jgi:hypothetical protein
MKSKAETDSEEAARGWRNRERDREQRGDFKVTPRGRYSRTQVPPFHMFALC